MRAATRHTPIRGERDRGPENEPPARAGSAGEDLTDDDFTPSTSAADFLKKQAPEDSSEFYDPEFDPKNILDSVEPYDWSQPVY